MFNADVRLADSFQRMPGQQIEILVNTSSQRILDRNNGGCGFPTRDGLEHLFKAGTRQRCNRAAQDLQRSSLAKRSQLPLKCHARTGRYRENFRFLHFGSSRSKNWRSLSGGGKVGGFKMTNDK